MWTIRVLATVFTLFILTSADDDLIVELSDGKVQGTTYTSPDATTFYTWRHIPYAKPPLNELRFMPPVRPDSWSGVLDGTKDSLACLFVGSYRGDPVPTYGYSEDCLYVNVYSPFPANSSLNLPVMFWIYGGGFKVGTGDFSFTDPTPLLEEGVIVVTFNYRLEIFGFLSTEDEVVPGNSALKDQLAALIWTRENIYNFGGNPLDITIFGESAGAMSVGYHLISPMSRNLFTGAILESGTALMDYLQSTPRSNAVKIAQQLDPSITEASSSELIVQVLQSADAELLANISLTVGSDKVLFKPVLEVDNVTPLITKPLYEEIEAGNITLVPIIIGTNSEEEIGEVSSLEDAQALGSYYDSNLNLLMPANMQLKEGASADDVTKAIKEAYVGDGTFNENPCALIRLLSDKRFVKPTLKHALLQSKFTPVYLYQFSFVGTRSAGRPEVPGCGQVGHADEVGYIFNISTKLIETEQDYLTRKRMVKLWTNFAKTKNPTPEDDSNAEVLQNVVWERLDEDNLQYLDIGEDLELKYNRESEEMRFWAELWETYAERPYNTF